LKQRLERGDKGINKLDEACKQHDIAYDKSNNMDVRHAADRELAARAWGRVKSWPWDAGPRERLDALGVAGAMRAKTLLGLGLRKPFKRQQRKRKGKRSNLRRDVKKRWK